MAEFRLSDGTELPVAGRDYVMENGLLVFTREYHLQRGICCGNFCRHCPYGHMAGSTVVMEDGKA